MRSGATYQCDHMVPKAIDCMSIHDQPITIDVGVQLEGDLSLPDAAPGIVVFAHGSGSSRGSPRNRYVAERLADAGLGTLLFDLRTPSEGLEAERTGRLRFHL